MEIEDTRAAREKGAIQAFTVGADPVTPLAVPGIHFTLLDDDRHAELAATMRVVSVELHNRLAGGDRAALALTDEGTIAGYGWISYDAIRIYELGLVTPLPYGHAYIWDCLTVPEYRGRHIFPGLLRFMLAVLRRQEIEQVWALVAPGNRASLRSFVSAGFRLVGYTSISAGRIAVEPTDQAQPREVEAMRFLAEHSVA